MSDREGEQLGNYRLIRFLGEGSFADVYLGEHVYLKRQAAIKVLRTRLAREDMENFLIEARTIASLEHPNIVQVLDFGVEKSIPFLVMSYAPNGTLRQRHPEGIPLGPTIILPYVKQIASALQYAHDRKLIHRDIKPHNLLLNPNNEVWISDFGLVLIAQSTMSQVTQNPAGTPAYMAPEQFAGKPRPASDQYALGVVVYEWLCGERPFRGTYSELFSQHNFIPAPSLREKIPAISPAVDEVVLTALAKDPYKRFSSVKAFANALEQACKAEPYLLPDADFGLPVSSSQVETPQSARPTPILDSLYSAAPTALPHGASSMAQQDSVASALEMPQSAARDSHPPIYLRAPASSDREVSPPASARKDTYASGHFNASTPPAPAQHGSWPQIMDSDVARLASSAAPAEPYTERGIPAQPPSPDSPTIADNPVPSQSPAPRKRELSRRTVLVGLVGTAVVVGGGAATLVWRYVSNANGTSTSTINPPGHPATPSSTPAPVGTTVFTYQEHKAGVRSVTWSPDGMLIASGSLDNTVRVWHTSNGQDLPFSPYSRHSKPLKTVAWLPGGQLIASGSEDATVRVWSATNGQDLAFSPYTRHTKTVRSVAWSPNGSLIASGSEDNTARVWNASNGQDLAFSPYTLHTNQVSCVSWSPDGSRIASASFDGTIRVWNASTGQDVLKPLVDGPSGARGVAWSHDGNFIATGGDNRRVNLWDSQGNLLHSFAGHTNSVESVAWSPDGKYIASGSFDSTVKVWDVAAKKLVATYHHHTDQVWSVAWSPDGKLIASASIDRTVRIWTGIAEHLPVTG